MVASLWTSTATSVSWPTLMRARPPPLSASCTTRAVRRRLAKCTRDRPPWIGWSRNRNVASPSPAQPPRPSGTSTALTLWTPRGTWISPWRWSFLERCLGAIKTIYLHLNTFKTFNDLTISPRFDPHDLDYSPNIVLKIL